MPAPQRLFAVTLLTYRKQGLDENDYHKYMSEKHSQDMKALMIKNGIVSYTMQHNAATEKQMTEQIFGPAYAANAHDCDCAIQIVFKDPEDFIKVRDDPEHKTVFQPDHARWADTKRTKMVAGWFEAHIADGQDADAGITNGH